jgi:23S rRNA (uracil1939-C5)-methyltransferase
MELKKNQEINLEITGMTHDGSGVGRYEGMAVFIPGCVPGDQVRAQILSIKKSYAYGKLLDTLRRSPARVESDCSVFLKCGGCSFRHISYEQELQFKYERVRDTLKKIAHLELTPEPILPSPVTEGYRNKAQFPVSFDGELHIGFYAPRSHRIVGAADCRLHPPVFSAVIEAFRQWLERSKASVYDERYGRGLVRHLFIRLAESTGELMVCIVANGRAIPQPELLIDLLRQEAPNLKSVILNNNEKNTNVILGDSGVTLWGGDYITDMLLGKRFEISALSFYQVNRRQAERLYSTAAEFLGKDGGSLMLDLYCGTGTIGICLSDCAKKIVGVEIIPEAIEDAKRNAAINSVDNIEFLCADASQAAAKLARDGLRPDSVIVDPPRKGLDMGTIDAVVAMKPKKIVYVSCDPATLARDLAVFAQNGYGCVRVRPVDMFPRTAHVECVVLMSRVKE